MLYEQYETSYLFYVILSFLCNIICYLISVFVFSLVTLSVATTPKAPFGTHPQLRARELSSPNIFGARVLLTSSPSYVSPSPLDRTQVVPSLPPIVSGAEIITSARVCARDFEPPVFFSHFRPGYSATTVCFIHLFIYLSIHSISYVHFNYVTFWIQASCYQERDGLR